MIGRCWRVATGPLDAIDGMSMDSKRDKRARPTQACARPRCPQDLDSGLRRSVGVPLLVLRGTPEEALPALWSKTGAERCSWEVDTEAYAKSRDARVAELARRHGVETHGVSGQKPSRS